MEGLPFGPLGFPLPSRTAPGSHSQQYILYATSTGQRAIENTGSGHGTFTAALLEALRGEGDSKIFSPHNLKWKVSFTSLVEFVGKQVKKKLQDLRPKDWQYIQMPVANLNEIHEDPVMASLSPEEIEPVPFRLRIKPSSARERSQVKVMEYSLGLGDFHQIKQVPPPEPVPLPCTFNLPPSNYRIEVQALGYYTIKEDIPLSLPMERDWELKPYILAGPLLPEPSYRRYANTQLEIFTDDKSIAIIVRNVERKVIRAKSDCGYWKRSVKPGYYYVALDVPGEPINEHLVGVLPGEHKSLHLPSPPPQMGTRQLAALTALGIQTTYGYLHPSEALSGVTKAKLASLLAFAAFAAIAPSQGMFHLKSMGIKRFESIEERGAGLLVLIGVGGDSPVPGISTSRFLSEAQLSLYDGDGRLLVDEGGFEILSGFPDAAQCRAIVAPASLIAEISIPGFQPTRYALTCLLERVTVLVIVTEDGGEIAAEQFLFPIQPLSLRFDTHDYLEFALSPGIDSALNVQRLEMAQRYYITGQKIPSAHLKDLLYGKWVEPLLGCLAGYSLIRAGKQAPFRDIGFEQQALGNMLRFFGDLPDSHVLAGLYEPERKDYHFSHALELGLPVFSEGFRYLREWYVQEDLQLPPRLTEPADRLVTTSPWTAWLSFIHLGWSLGTVESPLQLFSLQNFFVQQGLGCLFKQVSILL